MMILPAVITIPLDPATIAGLVFSAVMVLALTVWVTIRVYQMRISTGVESLPGSIARVVEWDGAAGRVHVQGEIWAAVADSVLVLNKNDRVRIVRVEDLTLRVKAE